MTDDYDDMKQKWHGVPPEEPELRPEDELTDDPKTIRLWDALKSKDLEEVAKLMKASQ